MKLIKVLLVKAAGFRFFRIVDSQARNIFLAAKKCLGFKKVLIISDKGITSIPISTKTQTGFVCACLLGLLWVSYATGRYFAHDQIISEKEKELWSTSVSNENLQYQVADLHKNLEDLNDYFVNLNNFDQIANTNKFANIEKSKKDIKSAKVDSPPIDPGKISSSNVDNVLLNIQDKVTERIDSLEKIINMTGVKVEEAAVHNNELKGAIENRKAVDSGQGGPYEPLESDDIAVYSEDFSTKVSYLLELEKLVNTMPISSPIQRYRITSRYGKRKDPIRKRWAMHNGTDLIGEYHAKVLSTAPGVVVVAKRKGAYGKIIEIDHGSGITTRYGHLHKIIVSKGDMVERGDIIGIQGNTGRSTGHHLHYEVRFDGKAVNPEKFLKAGKYVF